MRVVIFGANGQTGRLLCRRVLDAGHAVVAVTRRAEEFPISDPNLTVADADVRDGSALVDAVAAGEVDPVGGYTARIDLADSMVSLAGDPTAVSKAVVATTEHTPTIWQMVRHEAFKSA